MMSLKNKNPREDDFPRGDGDVRDLSGQAGGTALPTAFVAVSKVSFILTHQTKDAFS